MSKIPTNNPPSPLPTVDESPSPTATPAAPQEASESGFDSGSTTAPPSNQPNPPATQEALSKPTDKTSSADQDTSAPIPPPSSDVLADHASLATELFEIGGKYMSGEDIRRTIEIVEEMEAVVISSLERQLIPGPLKRGFIDKLFDPRTKKEVPGPDNKPRTVKVRSPEDHSDAVKVRYLSTDEKDKLIDLTRELPSISDSSSSYMTQSGFQNEMVQLLSSEKIPLHVIRRMLPIQESGSLTPISADSTTKPAPEFTPKTSTMLKEKARELGLIDDQ